MFEKVVTMEDEIFTVINTGTETISESVKAVIIVKGKCISPSLIKSVKMVVFPDDPRSTTVLDGTFRNMVLFADTTYGPHIDGYYFNRLTRFDGESDMDLLKRLYYETYPDERPVGDIPVSIENATQSIKNRINELVKKSIDDFVNKGREQLVEMIRKDHETELVLGNVYHLTSDLDANSLAIMKERFEKELDSDDLFIENDTLKIRLTEH